MNENVGRWQRTARLLTSVSMLIYGYLTPSVLILVVGLLLFATVLFAWCPIIWAWQGLMIKFKDD